MLSGSVFISDILLWFCLQTDVYKFGVIFVFIVFNVECRAKFLKIDYITRDPPHYSDKNYSPVEGLSILT